MGQRCMARATDFFVKGPQIFQGTAAPGQDNDLDSGKGPQVVQGRGDFPGGLRSLDLYGIDQHFHVGQRCPNRRRKSLTAAPVGEVTRAIWRGRNGRGFFNSGANSPSSISRVFRT